MAIEFGENLFVESTSEEQVGKAQPEMRVWSVRGRDGGQ